VGAGGDGVARERDGGGQLSAPVGRIDLPTVDPRDAVLQDVLRRIETLERLVEELRKYKLAPFERYG
jgi:hypothetical protein